MNTKLLKTLLLTGILTAACAASAEPADAASADASTSATPVTVAVDTTVDQLLDNMESVRKTITTMKAGVVKVREVLALEETEKYAGVLEFKTPRLLRMTLKSEDTGKEIIYIVGKTYGWIYRPQARQAERGALPNLEEKKKTGNPLEYGLARDIHGLKESYDLKLLPREKIGAVEAIPLELTPKGGADYAAGKVIFWIDPQTWLPVQVKEFKSNDEIIETHTFSNMQTNVKLDDDIFDFKSPKDVEVILHDAATSK